MEPLRILHLEDNLVDAALLEALLAESDTKCEIVRVDTKADFTRLLQSQTFDLIVSDYSLPGFDGKAALAFAHQSFPHIPFIFVSGTMGEDAAIESLTGGAIDYVLKHKFSRLVPAIQRGQRCSRERRLRDETQKELALRLTQLKDLFDNLDDVFFSVDIVHGKLLQLSAACERISGWPAGSFFENAHFWKDLVCDEDRWKLAPIESGLREGRNQCHGVKILDRKGSIHVVDARLKPVLDDRGTLIRVDGVLLDTSERSHPEEAFRQAEENSTDQRLIQKPFLRTEQVASIGMVASGIAHDMSNVLSPLTVAAKSLKTATLNDKDQSALETIEFSASRGTDLVNQLLTFAGAGEREPGLAISLPAVQLLGGGEAARCATLPSGDGELLLIADDHSSIRELARAMLEACGYRVMVAADGGEGLRIFLQFRNQINVVLLDINMPDSSGERMGAAIERMHPEVGIILMSAMAADPEDPKGTHSVQVRACVQKPFTAETLLVAVREVIRGVSREASA